MTHGWSMICWLEDEDSCIMEMAHLDNISEREESLGSLRWDSVLLYNKVKGWLFKSLLLPPPMPGSVILNLHSILYKRNSTSNLRPNLPEDSEDLFFLREIWKLLVAKDLWLRISRFSSSPLRSLSWEAVGSTHISTGEEWAEPHIGDQKLMELGLILCLLF